MWDVSKESFMENVDKHAPLKKKRVTSGLQINLHVNSTSRIISVEEKGYSRKSVTWRLGNDMSKLEMKQTIQWYQSSQEAVFMHILELNKKDPRKTLTS